MGTLDDYISDFKFYVNQANDLIQEFNKTNFSNMWEFRRAEDLPHQLEQASNKIWDIGIYVDKNFNKQLGQEMTEISRKYRDMSFQMSQAIRQNSNYWNNARY